MKRYLTIAVVSALALAPFTLAQEAALPIPNPTIMFGDTAPRTINVTGTGTVYGEPDIATLELGVNISNEDLAVATNEANERLAAITEALIEMGVEEVDIRTISFNVWLEERYGPGPRNEMLPPVYRVSNIVRVTVRDIEETGELLAAAINAGANAVHSVNYGIDNTEALEREARAEAMANAQDKAEQLAGLAGVGLGAVRYVAEGFTGETPQSFAAPMAMERAVSAVPVSGGQLAVSVVLNVSFNIE